MHLCAKVHNTMTRLQELEFFCNRELCSFIKSGLFGVVQILPSATLICLNDQSRGYRLRNADLPLLFVQQI